MAKQISVIQFAGKMGNAIGRRSRKGNPILGLDQGKYHNPNTKKQIEARTKFLGLCNAAGAFDNCLVGLTPYAKANGLSLRNAFMKVNSKVITVETTGSEAVATLMPDQVVLSKGSLETIGDVLSVTEAQGGGFDVVTRHDAEHSTRVKHVVFYDVDNMRAEMKIVNYSEENVHFAHLLPGKYAIYYFEADAPDAGVAVDYIQSLGLRVAFAQFRALANQMVYSETSNLVN